MIDDEVVLLANEKHSGTKTSQADLDRIGGWGDPRIHNLLFSFVFSVSFVFPSL